MRMCLLGAGTFPAMWTFEMKAATYLPIEGYSLLFLGSSQLCKSPLRSTLDALSQ